MWSITLVLVLICPVVPELTLCPLNGAGGLRHPTDLLALTDGQFLVSEQPGRVLHIFGRERQTVLNLEYKVMTSDSPMEERGLHSFALDQIRNPSNIYVCYSGYPVNSSMDHTMVLARFPLLITEDGKIQVDDSKENRLLTIGQPSPVHNGGYLFFSPQGKGLLYLTVGSGGGPRENFDRFDPSSFLGKILRLNVSDPSVTYTIPDGNAFESNVKIPPGAKRETFALGFWNPWRCSVDRHKDEYEERILCGDVGAGPENTDTVVQLVSGGLYGCCYQNCTSSAPIQETKNKIQKELYTHRHETGQALIGGPVYRGSKQKHLQGAYLFADFIHGTLHALRESKDGEQWTKTDLNVNHGLEQLYILSLTTDQNGELMLLAATDLKSSSASGAIYRIQESCTGGMPKKTEGNFTSLSVIFIVVHLIIGGGSCS